MADMVVKLPPIGQYVLVSLVGVGNFGGVVGKWDLRHPDGSPRVRVDLSLSDGEGGFVWVRANQCSWQDQ